jgi:hypothetical protein
VLVGLGQQDPELLAGDPARRVDAALPLRHVACDLLQGEVAGLMAALCVYAPEPVDLAHDDRHRAAGTA